MFSWVCSVEQSTCIMPDCIDSIAWMRLLFLSPACIQKFYKKSAALILRAVAKHSPELAQVNTDTQQNLNRSICSLINSLYCNGISLYECWHNLNVYHAYMNSWSCLSMWMRICQVYMYSGVPGPALDIQHSPVRVYLAHTGQPGQARSDHPAENDQKACSKRRKTERRIYYRKSEILENKATINVGKRRR